MIITVFNRIIIFFSVFILVVYNNFGEITAVIIAIKTKLAVKFTLLALFDFGENVALSVVRILIDCKILDIEVMVTLAIGACVVLVAWTLVEVASLVCMIELFATEELDETLERTDDDDPNGLLVIEKLEFVIALIVDDGWVF